MEHRRGRGKARRFEELCREQGIPVTHQRRVILDAVVARTDHPTADELFEDVRRKLPDVSRTTVYRVLELLVEFGLVTKISHPGATLRYDPVTERHHHLICLRCNRLFDLGDSGLSDLELPNTRRLGFKITDYSIHFRGMCRSCRRALSGRRHQGRSTKKRPAGAALGRRR